MHTTRRKAIILIIIFHWLATSTENCVNIDYPLAQINLMGIGPSAHYCLTRIRHEGIVLASILEKTDAGDSFRTVLHCANA